MAVSARNTLISLQPELFKDQAEKDIEELNRYFEDLKSIGDETEPLERNMKLITDDFNNQDYVKVRESCEKLKDKARRLKVEFLKVTLQPNIQDIMKQVQEKKKFGIDVTEIESYLADAEVSISDSDFDGASQLYKKAKDLFDEIPDDETSRRVELNDKLKVLKADLEKSSTYKINFDEINSSMEASESALADGDLDTADEKIENARTKLTDQLKDYTEQLVTRIELEVEDISLSGADTTSATKLVIKGRDLVESGEYFEAVKTLVSAERMAQDTGDSFVKVFEGLRSLSREITGLPRDSDIYTEILDLRNQTKKKLEEKDYVNALASLSKAMSLLSGSGTENSSASPSDDSEMNIKGKEKKKDEIDIKFDLPSVNVANEGGIINLLIRNSGSKIYRRVEGNCIMLSNDSPIQQKAFDIEDLMPNHDYKIQLFMEAVEDFESRNHYQLKVELSNIEGVIAKSEIDLKEKK